MRKTLLLITILLGISNAHAEDYTYLTIVGVDNSKISLTAVGLSISFCDGNLVAKNAYTEETATIALTNLASMYFSTNDETTGIHTILANASNCQVEAVYNLQGQQVSTNTPLRKGIYIIKQGNITQKIQIK